MSLSLATGDSAIFTVFNDAYKSLITDVISSPLIPRELTSISSYYSLTVSATNGKLIPLILIIASYNVLPLAVSIYT